MRPGSKIVTTMAVETDLQDLRSHFLIKYAADKISIPQPYVLINKKLTATTCVGKGTRVDNVQGITPWTQFSVNILVCLPSPMPHLMGRTSSFPKQDATSGERGRLRPRCAPKLVVQGIAWA
jgi:hypothetical protein